MVSTCDTLRDVKRAIRDGGYAWPGGYPLYVVMYDGEALSVAAARENWRQIVRETMQESGGCWHAFRVYTNWEDAALYCAHTGERIESAYGDE